MKSIVDENLVSFKAMEQKVCVKDYLTQTLAKRDLTFPPISRMMGKEKCVAGEEYTSGTGRERNSLAVRFLQEDLWKVALKQWF